MRGLRAWVGMATVCGVLLLSGCNYGGINSLQLPGTQGDGDGAYSLDIQMANVGNLVPNNPVRFRDVNVGTISSIRLDGWNALVTVRLNPDVKLPADTRAVVGQGSLLGAKYVELAAPDQDIAGAAPAAAAPAAGQLRDGDTIPLARTGGYPETEDVLASVAALLNGGGLQQIRTITTELGRALGGRTPQIRELITQLNTFVTGLDDQRGDIIHAIEGLDRMSAEFAAQDPALRRALQEIPPALEVLEGDRKDLLRTLDSLGGFGNEADRVLGGAREDLARNLENLAPALGGLADAGPSLVDSLYMAGTVVFPLRTFDRYIRGDFINFAITVDMTLGTLDQNFLRNTPFAGALGQVETILQNGGTVTQSVDPLLPAPLPDNRLPGLPQVPDITPPADQQPVPRQEGPAAPGAQPAPPAGAPATPEATPEPGPLGGLLSPFGGGN